VCSLLEVGGARVLLDCGCTLNTSNETLLQIAEELRVGGGVDCVLLSHADVSALFFFLVSSVALLCCTLYVYVCGATFQSLALGAFTN